MDESETYDSSILVLNTAVVIASASGNEKPLDD